MQVQENVALAPLTTFKVGGPAKYFVEAKTAKQVSEAVAFAQSRSLPLFVLGGGSNLIISDKGWPGLVIKIGITGIEDRSENGKKLFEVGAGEEWDKFVALAVSQNCAGVECLSGIPGSVGGTPVQNVGAYGQEVSETIESVLALDLKDGQLRELCNDACGFSYRTSIFNTSQRGRHIIVRATYALTPGGEPQILYADLKKHFSGWEAKPKLADVREAVRRIRASKGMLITPGDEDCRSAGSFFKNPIVSVAEANRIQALAEQRVPGKTMPRYPAPNGQVKLAAAWLVEQSGFSKGYSLGPVGISRKHSLAIVNRGGATAKDILALKDEIEKKVFDIWGVRLQPEPVFVGSETVDIP
jgi:UDP-N-acetylmuramate dehydrogenase